MASDCHIYSILADKKYCPGCQACYSVCQVKAINMEIKEGFYFPQISDKCAECHQCERVCPELDRNTTKKVMDSKVRVGQPDLYAVTNQNLQIRLGSSSGGIFSVLAEHILDIGGVVFGARFTEKFSVLYDWIETPEEIYKFRKSKYVQSYAGDMLKKCQLFLDEGCWGLFSGTSCQIAGLLRLLNKKYEILLTVDLICSCNISPEVWGSYISYMENKYKSRVKGVNFRDKKHGWDYCSLSIEFISGKKYIRNFPNAPWAQIFLNHQALRECCYNCQYKSITHEADFTLADFTFGCTSGT